MRSFLFLICLIAFTKKQFAQEQNLKFFVKGNIKGVKQPVKMVKLFYSVNGQGKEDSTLVKNGQYVFAGMLSEPTIGYFSVNYNDANLNSKPEFRRDQFVVFLDSGNITVTSIDSFSNRQVQGSSAHAIFEQLQQQEKPYFTAMTELQQRIAGLQKENKEPDAKALIEQAKHMHKKMRQEVYAAFIKANPDSPMSLFALDAFAGFIIDANEVEPLFNLIAEKRRNTWSGRAFKERLEAAKKTRIGALALDFTQTDTAGNPVSLASFRGKYLLLEFWASWCYPCRVENPNVVKAFQVYKNKGFTILGVSLDRPNARDEWLKAIRKDNLTWTHVSDLQYFDNAVAKLYGITAIPRNLLIDPAGKIIATDLRGKDLEEKLAGLLP